MYAKEDFGNANISQFIRLNNRLRANGFLSIPFLPDLTSPARSLILNRNQVEEDNNEGTNYLRYANPGVRLSEKLVQTSMIPQNLNDVTTPQNLSQIGETERQNDKFEITPGIRKYTDSEYSGLNTDDLRTVGSILHGICADRDNSFENEQNVNSITEIAREHSVSGRNKMDFPFDMPSNYSSKYGMKPDGDFRLGSSIELSFTTEQPESLSMAAKPESIETNQRLIVDGNKLISTIHNLLYELESRGEHTVETINSERSQKNGLMEKLNLLRRKYEALEKENESLRMINRVLTEEEQSNRKNRVQGRETPQCSTISKLEREKQQLLVENSRLKQDILKLQEDDDKSRDKADQFLRSVKSNLDSERDSNRASTFNHTGTSSNISGTTLTTLEKKKILQSHYLYSIIVGFEKSISYWKLQANGQNNLDSKNGQDSFEGNETNLGNSNDTISEKSFFEFCQENNISTSELMKRDKNLWTRGLYMLQNTDRSELESIVRWSCRLLNISNFRNIPIQIGQLLAKKSTSATPKITHIFESASSKKISSQNNSQEVISIELHDRFYNHFKTLFDVLDDQDVIQASNAIYIQLRDFKKFFKTICSTLSLDYKTTSPNECLKILTDLININHSKKAPNTQPQIQSFQENSSNVHNIIESLKIVLDVDSNDQILPTLKQHLESQSAIILSLSKS
ncbi:unnamed protein product [Cryptosporidium hominis]|uniref:Centrosomal protein of 70 kDa n=2 Tax=Cryptosporidium hominis TaxID=237895 RepID=A0A0S4TCR2_CRYHO|nr:hypothetical protein ChTU502y2012_384g0285 [Cryptosporidium hominis]PPA62858.1 hypothetical protein ChUKH1_14330 [Cryptosporidium hominis]PPS92478.1 Uncharacterized protein GY17_00003910 [Cryptosporidium hominis]CUV04829.1 unnamed protein product [Cryptosporidium hominis]|eukprot:PPS92478.1 Uncharacterized protein GY17_00003910 [Cryptosporidium hominis]